MTMFGGWLHRYQHIERLGHRAVAGILDGPPGSVVVQEKLDGANATVACEDPRDRTGFVICSRNTVLYNSKNDNQRGDMRGLVPYALERDWLRELARLWVLRGEWLVQHSIADYPKDAYGHLYLFDAQDYETGEYVGDHELHDVAMEISEGAAKIVPRISVDPVTPEALSAASTGDSMLGSGPREGIVVKRYDGWKNQFGDTVWAKLVGADFKERNGLHFTPQRKDGPEIAAASTLVTPEQVMKVIHKVADLHGGDVSVRNMQEVLGRVSHEIMHEELIDWIEKKKVGTFDFNSFRRLATVKARDIALAHFNGLDPLTR